MREQAENSLLESKRQYFEMKELFMERDERLNIFIKKNEDDKVNMVDLERRADNMDIQIKS